VLGTLTRWWKERSSETKPTDVASVALTMGSIILAVVALTKANQAAPQQQEQAAPVLAPGTPLEERGEIEDVAVEYAKVTKRLDRLFLDRSATTEEPPRGRLVIPLRNGGAGIALTVGLPVVVADCAKQPALMPSQRSEPLVRI
jgi:hypothetical protein